ncbi:hypothetical protein [Salinirarus marinus]
MNRRCFLGVCGTLPALLAGCLGDDGERESETPTPDDALPEACPRSLDVEGVPERPDELTRDSVTEFLTEYEYTLAPARNPDYTGLNYLEHLETERVDEGFRVHFFAEPIVAQTPTDSTSSSTTPVTEGTYNVAYLLTERRIVRTTRVGPTPYTGLRPRKDGTLVAC